MKLAIVTLYEVSYYSLPPSRRDGHRGTNLTSTGDRCFGDDSVSHVENRGTRSIIHMQLHLQWRLPSFARSSTCVWQTSSRALQSDRTHSTKSCARAVVCRTLTSYSSPCGDHQSKPDTRHLDAYLRYNRADLMTVRKSFRLHIMGRSTKLLISEYSEYSDLVEPAGDLNKI